MSDTLLLNNEGEAIILEVAEQGPPGPAGPAGQAGPAGPEGPAGPAGSGSSRDNAALTTVNVYTKNQSVAPAALGNGEVIAVDASLSNNFKLVMSANGTLANPSNLTDGMVLNFRFKQDGAGSHTLAFGSAYKFPGDVVPALSTAPGTVDLMGCYYDSAEDVMACNLSKGFVGTVAAAFSPLSLPSLLGWFDASDVATVTAGASNLVSSWLDKSGNANHAVPNRATPYTYVAAGVNRLGCMSGTQSGMSVPVMALPAQAHYAFMVMSNTHESIGLGTTSGGNDYLLRMSPYASGSLIEGYQTFNSFLSGLGAGTTDNSPHVLSHTTNAAAVTLGFDGTSNTDVFTGGYNVNELTCESIASSYFLSGNVCEIILGGAALTAAQITSTQAYLKTKWGTP